MTRLVIADAHLGQADGDSEVMGELVARAISGGVTEIVYLGDVCQYLIGLPKFWTSAVHRMIEAWREARSAGVRVVVIEGNRDFFLDEPPLAGEIDVGARTYQVVAGDRCIRFVHGDLVNRRDLQYRFWSTVSKSWPARVWARLLPTSLAVTIVRRMEERLAKTNRKYRYVKPKDDLERSARAAWSEGVDLLLWGHFHTPWWTVHDHRMGLVIPAWLETRIGLSVDDDGAGTWVDATLTPVAPLSTMKPCPPQATPIP